MREKLTMLLLESSGQTNACATCDRICMISACFSPSIFSDIAVPDKSSEKRF